MKMVVAGSFLIVRFNQNNFTSLKSFWPTKKAKTMKKKKMGGHLFGPSNCGHSKIWFLMNFSHPFLLFRNGCFQKTRADMTKLQPF